MTVVARCLTQHIPLLDQRRVGCWHSLSMKRSMCPTVVDDDDNTHHFPLVDKQIPLVYDGMRLGLYMIMELFNR